MSGGPIRPDFEEILRLVRPGSRVLDVGCGEGELLDLLTRRNAVDGRGLEISPGGVSACLARGLSVMQGDADRDLDYFAADAFDYVILSQTLQAVLRPRHVLGEMLRIGRRAIVSLPNFGHWRVRLDLLLHGRMPMTKALPEPWWATSNIHLCTMGDFTSLCADMDLAIDACAAFAGGRRARAAQPRRRLENLRAESALFLLSRSGER
ncbi:MAG TPA: methionine biosynthesis protein MetW [Caulobacteraceae bacterium]